MVGTSGNVSRRLDIQAGAEREVHTDLCAQIMMNNCLVPKPSGELTVVPFVSQQCSG